MPYQLSGPTRTPFLRRSTRLASLCEALPVEHALAELKLDVADHVGGERGDQSLAGA